MAVPELPEELFAAGEEYLAQLRSLGLRPEGLFWVHHVPDDRFVLQLIWSGIDKYGPLSLSKLLFKAYRAAALTRRINPMIVEVRSPKEQTAAILLKHIAEGRVSGNPRYWRFNRKPMFGGDFDPDGDVIYEWQNHWVYHIQMRPRSVHDVRKDWGIFKKKVDALAA